MSLFGDFGMMMVGGEVATAVPAASPLALVSRNSSSSFTDGATVTFTTEAYDTESVIAVTSGTLTVPSTGLYRLSAAAAVSGGGYRALKASHSGSLDFDGLGTSCESSSPQWMGGAGAIQSLGAGETVSLFNSFGSTNYGVDGTEYTWACLERLPASISYALVRQSANQTGITSSTDLTFDTESADVGGWHDNVTNKQRLTVPSGVTRVRVLGNITTNSVNTPMEFGIAKNGSLDVRGLPHRRETGSGNKLANLFSPPINVTPGDYFTLKAASGSSSSTLAGEYTWFSIEEVPAAIKSALLYHSSGHSLTTTDAFLNWDSEDHDPDAMHSTSSNTSRLTVPSGCTFARLHFGLKGQLNSTATIWSQVKKNGASVIGTAIDSRPGASGTYQRLSGASGWVPVTPGDYFELQARINTGSITTTGGWFAMECI